MPTLVVVKEHPYEGRRREVGSEYDATDFDASVLVQSGQARYKDAPLAAQTYQTRDMTAQGSGASVSRARRKKVLTA